jgi:2-hydroxy-3-oxopropionate reductase
MIRVLQGGVAATRLMEVRGPRMTAGDFAPGFKAAHHYKDLRIVLDEAQAMGVTLPTTSRVAEMFGTLVAEGQGTLDNSAVLTMVERAAGAARAARS